MENDVELIVLYNSKRVIKKVIKRSIRNGLKLEKFICSFWKNKICWNFIIVKHFEHELSSN